MRSICFGKSILMNQSLRVYQKPCTPNLPHLQRNTSPPLQNSGFQRQYSKNINTEQQYELKFNSEYSKIGSDNNSDDGVQQSIPYLPDDNQLDKFSNYFSPGSSNSSFEQQQQQKGGGVYSCEKQQQQIKQFNESSKYSDTEVDLSDTDIIDEDFPSLKIDGILASQDQNNKNNYESVDYSSSNKAFIRQAPQFEIRKDSINSMQKQVFWLHKLILRQKYARIHSFLNANLITKQDLNQLDTRKNTPFLLLLKLAMQQQQEKKEIQNESDAIQSIFFNEQLQLAQKFIEHGADITIRDMNGWSAFDDTITQGNITFSVFLFQQLRKLKLQKWNRQRETIIAKLIKIPDFFVEIKWNCSSPIPLLAKFAPSDTFKIWKIGSSVRLDFTCVGWKGGQTKRRNMTVIFRDRESQLDPRFRACDVLLINRSKKTIVNIMEELDQEEKIAILHDLINSDPVRGQFKITGHNVQPAKNIFGKLKKRKINQWNCQKYQLKFSALVSSETKAESQKIALQQEDYFDQKAISYSPQVIKQQQNSQKKKKSKTPNLSKVTKKNISCSVWTSPDFPLQFQNLITVVQSISDGNNYITKLQDFLKQQAVSSLLSKNGFPVKIQVPVKYSIRAIFRFQKFEFLKPEDAIDKQLFSIPKEFEFVSRKEGSKMLEAKNKKKRLLLAMAQIRV